LAPSYLDPETKVWIQQAEWDYAHGASPDALAYRPADLPPLTAGELEVCLIDGDAEPWPGVQLLSTPGHCPGHMSMLVELPDGWIALAADAAVVNIMVDADNLPLDGRAEFGDAGNQLLDDNTLREGIHFGQIFSRKGFIHDGDGEAARGVLFGERAALNHADAEGPEVFRSHHTEARAGTRGRNVDSLSGEVEGHAEIHAYDGHSRGSGDGRDSRKCANLIQELAVKRVDLFGMGEAVVCDGQKKR